MLPSHYSARVQWDMNPEKYNDAFLLDHYYKNTSSS